MDGDRLRRMSIIEEGADKQVRMAHLAIVGSCSVNGVAALHTRLLKEKVLRDFAELWPGKFNNKTNGITPRRWLLKANPPLAQLVTETIGSGWITDLKQLRKLEPFADDDAFQERFRAAKQLNKIALAGYISHRLHLVLSPKSLFDVQVKRLHEYKRQLMLVLYTIVRYNRLKRTPAPDLVPRAVIFSAKAAPGYAIAKLIIKLIHQVAETINADPQIGDKLKVVFVPNYRVSLAERIIPAADLSEQISLAGTEASGTGNMKLQLNGALTIGTLDGANVEILEEVGAENIFIFGLKTEEVEQRRRDYNPWDVYHQDAEDPPGPGHDPQQLLLHGGTWNFRPVGAFAARFRRPLHALGRPPGLYLHPREGRCRLPGPSRLDAQSHPQRGPGRQVQLGSNHPGIRFGDLALDAMPRAQRSEGRLSRSR